MTSAVSAVPKLGLVCALALLSACTAVSPVPDFGIEHLNPDTMVDPAAFGYSQVVTVNNGRTIYLAGQGPTKLNEKSPKDLRGQAANAVDNILLALEAAGAGPENIVYLRINVVDYNPKMLIDIACLFSFPQQSLWMRLRRSWNYIESRADKEYC